MDRPWAHDWKGLKPLPMLAPHSNLVTVETRPNARTGNRVKQSTPVLMVWPGVLNQVQ